LRPANPYFIFLSLLLAVILNFIPWHVWLAPDMVALVLLFWNIRQPRKVSIGVAVLLGLCVDVQNGVLLGQHMLAYSLMSFFAIILHRRELWLNRWARGLYIVVLLLLTKLIYILEGSILRGQPPNWLYLSSVITEAILWPWISWLLLAPQRRAEDVDTTRPL
jgi:rod shape-determining protein MreD